MKIIIKKYMLFIFSCLVCTVVCGCGTDTVSISEKEDIVSENISDAPETTRMTDAAEETAAEEAAGKILVYVCGAVACPGVYELDAKSRVNDALEAAGGFSEDADRNVINLAEDVSDGERIYFPVYGEHLQQETDADRTALAGGDSAGNLININEADVSELTELPGIGETRAGQIIEYRQTYGRFADKEDLKNVSGIGDSTYKKLEAYITVD